tara:strand:- start:1614 stop:2918 length:1305 start_codon:yes stop_codon:yes gene_type:complete
MSDVLKYKARVLDTKSQSFCGAKWYEAVIFLGSGKTMSCHHNPYHEVSDTAVLENYKAIHNTSEKKQQRAEMLRGERSEGCNYCWRLEDNNSVSDRVYKSQKFTDADNQLAFDSDPNADVDLQSLELHFDKVCQMACSYCHAGYSTTWAQDIKQNGAYKNVETDKKQHYKYQRRIDQLFKPDQENLYTEAFYKWWDADLHRTLKELRILGGEPLLSPHIWRFIEWFKSKDTECSLEFVTNLGPKVNVPRFLNAVDGKQVVVMTSMETVGEHAEYTRDGVDYELWCKNVELCLQSKTVSRMSVLFTVNALSVFNMCDLMAKIIHWRSVYGKDRINMSINILRYPVFQNITVLSDTARQQVATTLEQWLELHGNYITDYEYQQLERLVNYVRVVDAPDNLQDVRKDFKSFFTQYDKRRGKSFKETFPELADWYRHI